MGSFLSPVSFGRRGWYVLSSGLVQSLLMRLVGLFPPYCLLSSFFVSAGPCRRFWTGWLGFGDLSGEGAGCHCRGRVVLSGSGPCVRENLRGELGSFVVGIWGVLCRGESGALSCMYTLFCCPSLLLFWLGVVHAQPWVVLLCAGVCFV